MLLTVVSFTVILEALLLLGPFYRHEADMFNNLLKVTKLVDRVSNLDTGSQALNHDTILYKGSVSTYCHCGSIISDFSLSSPFRVLLQSIEY